MYILWVSEGDNPPVHFLWRYHGLLIDRKSQKSRFGVGVTLTWWHQMGICINYGCYNYLLDVFFPYQRNFDRKSPTTTTRWRFLAGKGQNFMIFFLCRFQCRIIICIIAMTLDVKLDRRLVDDQETLWPFNRKWLDFWNLKCVFLTNWLCLFSLSCKTILGTKTHSRSVNLFIFRLNHVVSHLVSLSFPPWKKCI